MELNDVCELIIDCEHKTAPTQDTGYPSIRTPNIGRGRFLLDGVNRVSEETYQLWTRRAVPRPGDLIMAREAPVGNVAMIPNGLKPCLGQRTLLIRPDPSRVNSSFLNYFLNGPVVQSLVHSKTNGATVAHLNMKDVRTMVLPELPPLPTQQRIASILAAYDELIENSQRRIKILEAMARGLYREWFVHFRFPGHENHPRVASALGEIPLGWEVKNLGGLTKLITKGTTPTTLGRGFQQDGINFVKAESIEASGILIETKFAKIDADTHELLQRSQLCSGDILFSIAGVIGRVCSVPSRILPANTNQALAIVRCASALHVPFLYMTLRDENFKNHCLGHVVQTAQANVSLSVLKAVPIVCPPSGLLTEFNAHTESLLRQIQVLSEKIQNSRRTRDLLLPRLLSGQINVDKTPERIAA